MEDNSKVPPQEEIQKEEQVEVQNAKSTTNGSPSQNDENENEPSKDLSLTKELSAPNLEEYAKQQIEDKNSSTITSGQLEIEVQRLVEKLLETRRVNEKKEDFRKKMGDPGPTACAAFALTTLIFALHNVGVWNVFDVMMLGMAVFFGGLTQFISGFLEFVRVSLQIKAINSRKGNTFNMVVFASFGAFNLTTLFNVAMPLMYETLPAPSAMANGFFYFLWGFLGFLFLSYSLIHTPLITISQMVFGSVVGLFWTNAISQWCKYGDATTAALVFQRIAGVVGLICGILATYLCAAQMMNDGKIILPLEFPIFKRKKNNLKDV